MAKQTIDFAHKVLTHNLVILAVGILLALLVIISEN